MKRPPKVTYEITMRSGFDKVEGLRVEGYRVSPNFAAREASGAYQLDHIGSGYGIAGVKANTLKEAQADAETLERATYPNGNKFHWETLTRKNAGLRAKRAGKGFLSRALGRNVKLYPVG